MQRILRRLAQQILPAIPYWGVLALLIYMPFHVFVVQSLSLATGGLEVWKAAKDVLLAILVVFTICLVFWQKRAGRAFILLVAFTAAYGVLHGVQWALNPDIYERSAIIGTIYNMRVPCFAILGYGAVLLTPHKFAFRSIMKVVVGVSTTVVILGIVQFILPGDILSHAGYSLERGARPAFYIDDNFDLPHRVMSTLREPNAFGAYLILPITVLTAYLLRVWRTRRIYLAGALLAIHFLALFLTFSRSAWLAAFVAVLLVILWNYKRLILTVMRRWWPLVAAGLVAFAAVAFAVRDTYFFQQYVVHSNPNEQVQDLDSNDYHALFVRQGLEGIADEPLGHGPGTAGLASIQNPDGGQLTENYYIQIGYELGVLGAALFVAGNVWLYVYVWRRSGPMAVVLCTSFWGYVITNMLLHSWSSEAVAAQWWLLAGVAIGQSAASGTIRNSKKRTKAVPVKNS